MNERHRRDTASANKRAPTSTTLRNPVAACLRQPTDLPKAALVLVVDFLHHVEELEEVTHCAVVVHRHQQVHDIDHPVVVGLRAHAHDAAHDAAHGAMTTALWAAALSLPALSHGICTAYITVLRYVIVHDRYARFDL